MTGVFPDWSGEVAAVVAGGQSAALLAPLLRGRCRIIVVNLAFRLIPDADVLYAADSSFWQHYRDAHNFDGLKLSPDDYGQRYCPSVHRTAIARKDGRRVRGFVRDPVGTTGDGGGNSAFQAVNLAAQFGAHTVLLAGIDFAGVHWHRDHPAGLRNPTPNQFKEWRETMDAEAGVLREWGVRAINLSNTSALRAFPHGHPDSYLPDPRPTALQAGGVPRGPGEAGVQGPDHRP